ncbi:hypothetical protein [Tropicibacter alexandrii]|uniref:hypothetical protein n=1 Tax=Tropicibacter alexandrii TaxID=2267683 RepID=UPI001008951A|nr:hypothetical protein [Tropicibacter alexandrii]
MGALLVTVGLLILHDPRRPVLAQALVTIAAMLGWGALWGGALTFGPNLHDFAKGTVGPATIALTIAGASWVCVVTLLLLIGRKRTPAPAERRALLGVLALSWFCALLLPFLGQNGAWPPSSVRLAVGAAGLAWLISIFVKV